MGVKWSRAALDAQTRAMAQANREFAGMINKELNAIAPTIESIMHTYSDLSKNRISSKMINAMRAGVFGTQLRFGFIADHMDYFTWQTVTGFVHWKSGEFIAPSLAIADAKQDAEVLMIEACRRVRRNYMARLRRR